MPNQFNVSLWGDEAFSAVLSSNTIPELIKIIARDTSPPLYNISEHLWFSFFGNSEVAIRSLSFLYFLIAVFFTYKIGALLWDRKTGLLAGALTFLNPFFFIYAFEGRMYSILAATVAASMYFFLSLRAGRKGAWVGYIVSTAAALYSHHFAVFAVFAQGLWFLKEFVVGNRKTAIKMLRAFAIVALLYAPWLIPLYNQTKMVGGGFWLSTPTIKDLGVLIKDYLAEGVKHQLTQPVLCLALVGLALRKWTKNIEKSLFLVSWFLLPILFTWFISQKFQSIFFNRYLLYTIPAAMLLLASNGKKFFGIIIAILLPLLFIIDFSYFTHPTKKPFRELASYVKETKRGDDFLINWNAASHHLWESKYYGIPAPLYIPEGDLPFYVGTAQMTEEDILREIPKKINRVGVITSGDIAEIELPYYTEEEAKTFGGLKFVWYQKTR
jgi:uncharacterized membrane protein